MRPLAVMLTMIGWDDELGEAMVMRCDPAGHYTGYHGVATGPKASEIQATLEKRLVERGSSCLADSLPGCIELAVETLATALGSEPKPGELEVGVVSRGERQFKLLPEAEIEAILQAIAEKD